MGVLRIQRYIFRGLVRSVLLVLVVITGVVFLGAMVQSVGRFHDVSLSILLARLPYLLPGALKISMPLALLVGTLLTYGRLSADNEILAVRTAGIHPLHLVTPALVLGLLLTGLCIPLNGTVAPRSERIARRVRKDDLLRFLASMEEQRVHRFRSDRFRMEWREVADDGALLDVSFDFLPEEGERIRGGARRAVIQRNEQTDEFRFVFFDVSLTQGSFTGVKNAKREVIVRSVAELFGAGSTLLDRSQMTNAELRYRFTRDPLLGRNPRGANIVRFRMEYWRRLSLAFACLVFALVGTPVGVLFRRGSFVGAGLVGAATAFLGYYPLLEVGKSLVYEGVVSPELGMSLPCLVLAAAGVLLLLRVCRH